MRKVSSEDAKRINRVAAIICLTSFVFICVIMAMPFFSFTSTVFTKKSSNTFVGDEKYYSAREEAEKAAEEYNKRGIQGELLIDERVTLRQNSKGDTTSLVTFNVNVRVNRSGYDYIKCGLPSGVIIKVIVVLVGLSALLGLCSLYSNMSKSVRELGKTTGTIRGIACWLALAGVILVPVFVMSNNFIIERRIIPSLSSDASKYVQALDQFLYSSQAGEEIGDMIQSLVYSSTPWLWILLVGELSLLSGLVIMCKGSLAHTVARGGLYLFVIALSAIILYPYYVMLITAFRSNAETTDMYFTNLLPTQWVWTNILDIANRGVPRFLLNSLMLSGGATCIALLCGIPAAYAMARMSFKGKKAFLGFVIMSQMFAPVVLLVGISRLMNTIKLNDTITGLMFINAAFNQAFAIWLLRGTFVSISSEMEQAACIDGCSTMGALVRVLLPMAAPGIVTTLIFVFINAWNEYTISTVLIATPIKKPITVGITQFSSFNMIEWQYLFASALIATIPVIILFMFIEKHLVSGLTSGGVKG